MLQNRPAPKFLRVLTLATLLAAAAPLSLLAQEPAPAAAPTAAASAPAETAAAPKPPAAAKADAKPSQEEQNNVFRLDGPIVKWTAKTTGWSPETSATVFEFFNFAVLVFGIGIPLGRKLPKIFRKRTETVRADLEEARKATQEAGARLSAVEAKLAGLAGEMTALRTQVEQESAQDEVRIKAGIEEEKGRIVALAEQEINVAAQHARRGLQTFAAGLAIEQAAGRIALTPESDRALIEEFLHGVGGQN